MKQNHQDGEILDVVDMDDLVIGQETRKEIHYKGLIHRSVHIFVFNLGGELYLQKRAYSKDENPGLWDSSSAGHVESGESYIDCAYRELKEELNIDAALEEKIRLKPSSETAWEHVVVYFCETDLKPIPNSSEIIDGSFRHLVDISNEIMVKPDIFTSTFKKIFTTIF